MSTNLTIICKDAINGYSDETPKRSHCLYLKREDNGNYYLTKEVTNTPYVADDLNSVLTIFFASEANDLSLLDGSIEKPFISENVDLSNYSVGKLVVTFHAEPLQETDPRTCKKSGSITFIKPFNGRRLEVVSGRRARGFAVNCKPPLANEHEINQLAIVQIPREHSLNENDIVVEYYDESYLCNPILDRYQLLEPCDAEKLYDALDVSISVNEYWVAKKL
ncbi:hypothetical protein [Vibrio alginolyticus]|uniref:hypothetical protein n=1 Tax=Vibrio alginolyticus TaxID=663 RepID=UPI0006CA9FCC|nr:hypothetical protein [Vibrio alginolyticus]KPM97514.1 hypothetical protein AOG25_13665 [Vibrio alginolyticus]CAH7192929.1 conserved hypothetical protein [Vibrio chagasii]CAH7360637.1 conserved hypothetical protein [Vibrio chagasii]